MEVIPRTFYLFRRMTSKFHFCQILVYITLIMSTVVEVKFYPTQNLTRVSNFGLCQIFLTSCVYTSCESCKIWQLQKLWFSCIKFDIRLRGAHSSYYAAAFSPLSNFNTSCETLLFSEIFSILFIEGEGRSNSIRSSFRGNDFWKLEKSRNLLYNIYRKWERT